MTAKQTAELIELLKNPPAGEEQNLVELLTHRVPAGVDDAAKVKASYLAAVALGKEACALISRAKATELLGTMLGGYNIGPLIELLDDAEIGTIAAEALKKTLLMFDSFHDVKEKADKGNANARAVLQSWADAEWFTSRPELPQSLTITVFKVPGETNTDDLSPAPDATTRPDIPMHALAMLKNKREGAAFQPEEDGKRGPVKFIESLKEKGHLVAYVGDVVGTGSSRKSATNSVLWFTGEDIPSCRTSASAACAWAARSPRSSTTPWKTPAPCRSSWTCPRWKWATWSNCVPTTARPSRTAKSSLNSK